MESYFSPLIGKELLTQFYLKLKLFYFPNSFMFLVVVCIDH